MTEEPFRMPDYTNPPKDEPWRMPLWGWGLVLLTAVLLIWQRFDDTTTVRQTAQQTIQRLSVETAKATGEDLMSDKILDVTTKDELDAALKSGVVLIDFHAPWCGPCRMQGPILAKLANSMGDSVKIIKINTEDAPDLASAYDVSSIPMLLLFKDGQQVQKFIGLQQENSLRSVIEAAQ